MERVVVVGASLAGLRSVEFLRRKGYPGAITLIGEETHEPYDRPPLSKEILRGEWAPERIALRRKGLDALELDLRLGVRATALDTGAQQLSLSDGTTVSYDGLIVATGAQVRTLPNQPALAGLFTLRTLDDALALRQACTMAPAHVVVVGAGFIGAEVAASCRALGLAVTMVELERVPLCSSLGERLGEKLKAIHEANGVEVRCGVGVKAIEGDGAVERVVLDDGGVIVCGLVVVGIGVRPATDWLKGSRVALGDGVVCDETCASSVPNVVAAGDVASWYNPLFEERMRIEHWTNAVEQARHAVDTLLAPPGEGQPFAPVPLFWSDQYQFKIQGVGRPRPSDELHVCHGSLNDDKFVVLYGRENRLMAAVAFNNPPQLMKYRRMIAERASWDAALDA